MAEHVILFCNLEHLRAHDIEGTPGKWAFGLNLAVGISGEITGTSLDALKPYMQPWTWPGIAQIKVRVSDGAGGRTTTQIVEPVKWKGELIDCGHCRDEVGALRNDLDDEYERSKAVGFDAFTWTPGAGGLSKSSTIRSKPWHTFVGQLSTNPAPFPQCLNLSFIFFIDKLTTSGPKSVFAAPLLPKTSVTCAELSLPWSNALVPKGDAPQNGTPGIFQWEYQTDTGSTPSPALFALMAECKVRLPGAPVATFLDLDSQWVNKLPDGADLFAEDWRPMVEERMADALDIPQRIIEYLRANANDQSLLPKLKLFQWAAIASLRDLVGPGIYAGPDNRRFVDFAFKTVKDDYPGITQTQVDSIEPRVIEKFGTLTDWLTFLTANLPEVSNLSVLSLPRLTKNDAGVEKPQKVVPEEQATVESVVAELEQLHKVVLDPKNLSVLVKQQWRALFKEKLSDDEMALLEKVDLDSLNVRHYLALENLGDLWKVFIRMQSDGGSGHDIIRRNFSCLFQEYFCKRFGLSLAGLTADLGGPPVPCDVMTIEQGDYRSNQHTRQPDNLMKKDVTTFKFELDEIRSAIVDYIRTWSKRFVENLLPQNTEATIVPHAITMQVDGLAARPGDSHDPEQQDILRRISGIGVLMRQEGKEWRCLNFAAAYDKAGQKVSDPILVPSRLNYRNDLRQAFLSYNNQPLTAESPLTEDAMTPVKAKFQTRLSPEEEIKQNPRPSLRLKYSTDPTVPIASKLPALEFGKKFDILPFMVANCGALPGALLANDLSKRSLIEASVADFSEAKLTQADRDKIRRNIEYRRRVRIGGIRVLDHDRKVSLKLPPIPETVVPRARDIHRSEFDRVKLFSSAANPDPAEHSVLLLAPEAWAKANDAAKNTFDFWIRKPATDVNTWDRWIGSSFDRVKRVSVWADFYRQSESKRKTVLTAQGTDKFEQTDTSIDDPATLNQFFFELWVIDGSSTTPLKTKWVEIVDRTNPQRLKLVQSKPTHVICAFGENEDIKVTRTTIEEDHVREDVNEVTITVKKGQVYQLNIFSYVAKTDYATKFDDVISAKREAAGPDGTTPVYLVSPFTMLVETATEVLIEGIEGSDALKQTDQRLWERLKPAFAPTNHPGSIAFTVAPTDPIDDEGFKFLLRAELMRQVWRWQGRETPLHPALNENSLCRQGGAISNLDTCPEVDEWEAWEFGNRFETDHLIQDMKTLPPTKLGGRKFFYKEVLETGADTDELRALHYRFALKVHSRYAGIMPPNVPSVAFPNVAPSRTSHGHIELPPNNEVRDTLWRRLFVPCRRKKELPVPKVKFILPLTESFGEETGNTAGLLLVLNEPWYQEAGLGEGIAAEVQMTPDPENPLNPQTDKSPQNKKKAEPNKDTFYFELGTDPLVRVAERGFRQSNDPANQYFDEMCLNQKIRGPVGHTFDRTNESPLFATTSFIIPAPTIFTTEKGKSRDAVAHDFGWDFCRLRLRRVVTLSKKATPHTDCRLTAPGEVLSCDLSNAGSQLVGPFTEPYWVQYLPEFSHFAPADAKLSQARLKLEQKDPPLKFSIIDRNGQRMLLSPTASLKGIFELYLVLTRRVFDVAGRPEQEVYLEVFHQDTDPKLWTTSAPPVLSSDAELRARIIEVQRRPPDHGAMQKFPSGEPLWKALFGPKTSQQDNPADKDLARIVRISQPIEGLSTTSINC